MAVENSSFVGPCLVVKQMFKIQTEQFTCRQSSNAPRPTPTPTPHAPQADKQADKQANRQANRQADKQTSRKKKQTDKYNVPRLLQTVLRYSTIQILLWSWTVPVKQPYNNQMEFVLVRNLDLFMNFKVCLLRKTENDSAFIRFMRGCIPKLKTHTNKYNLCKKNIKYLQRPQK